MILGSTGKSIRISENLQVYPSDITGETVEVTILPDNSDEPITDTVNPASLYRDVLNAMNEDITRKRFGYLRATESGKYASTQDWDSVELTISNFRVTLTNEEFSELHDILEDICKTRDAIRNEVCLLYTS